MNLLNTDLSGDHPEDLAPPGTAVLTFKLVVDRNVFRDVGLNQILAVWADVQPQAMADLIAGPIAKAYRGHHSGVTLHPFPPRVEINFNGNPDLCAYVVGCWALPHLDITHLLPSPAPATGPRARLHTLCGCESRTFSLAFPADYIRQRAGGGIRIFRLAGHDVFGTAIFKEQ